MHVIQSQTSQCPRNTPLNTHMDAEHQLVEREIVLEGAILTRVHVSIRECNR